MKAALCKASCEELDVRPVGAGLVVSTPFEGANGERLGFYIVRGAEDPTLFRLEDDGATIPLLEAGGIDFETDTRQAALTELLTEYRASYDADLTTLMSGPIPEAQAPAVALRFAANRSRCPPPCWKDCFTRAFAPTMPKSISPISW